MPKAKLVRPEPVTEISWPNHTKKKLFIAPIREWTPCITETSLDIELILQRGVGEEFQSFLCMNRFLNDKRLMRGVPNRRGRFFIGAKKALMLVSFCRIIKQH